jgi:hypothetical protein
MLQGAGKEQISKTAEDLVEWSNRSRERIAELVRAEVRAQLRQLGVASRDEVEALRRRVRELEKTRPATTAPAKKTTARRRPASRRSQASTTGTATATA